MNNKRGVRHVEAILSFVFFIGFGITAIYYLNPLSMAQNGGNVLEKISNQIIDNSSIVVEKYAVIVAPSSGGAKANLVIINLGEPIKTRLVPRVTDINGEEIPSSVIEEGDLAGQLAVKFKKTDKAILFVYLAEDFTANNLFPSAQREFPQGAEKYRTYQISSLYSTEVISLKRIDALKKQYTQNYDSLREYFEVPKGRDFGFVVDTIKAEKKISKGVNVFARKERMKTIGLDNSILFKELEVKAW